MLSELTSKISHSLLLSVNVWLNLVNCPLKPVQVVTRHSFKDLTEGNCNTHGFPIRHKLIPNVFNTQSAVKVLSGRKSHKTLIITKTGAFHASPKQNGNSKAQSCDQNRSHASFCFKDTLQKCFWQNLTISQTIADTSHLLNKCAKKYVAKLELLE